MREFRVMLNESFEIPPVDDDVRGYLKTVDGLVVLRNSIPETFEIAKKMLEILKKRMEA